MSNGVKALLIVVAVLVTLFLAGSSILFMMRGRSIIGVSNKLIEEKEFEDIENISVKTDISDVYFRYSNDDNYKVEIYSDKPETSVIDVEDDNLVVEFKEKNKFVLFGKNSRILIYVPKTFENDIKVTSTTGDVLAVDFEKANFNISLSTGDVSLGIVKNADISSTTGDITIQEIQEKFNITTTTGDVRVQNISIKEDSSIIATTGDIRIVNNKSNVYIDADTRTGDTNINDNNRRSDIELKIKTTTGDINIG